MTLVTLHVDCTEGACGTQVFASTTSDATLGIDHRYAERTLVLRIRGHHLNGPYRTVARTVSARASVGQRYTVLLHPHRMANLCRRLVLACDGAYGTCGAHLRALRTLGAAIAMLVVHFWLHQSGQVGRWGEHPVRTSRYAKLACRAMLGKVTCAQCTGRHQVRLTVGCHLIHNGRQSAIHLLLLRLDRRGSRYGRRRSQEGTARCIHRSTLSTLCRGRLHMLLCYALLLASVDTVHASHATRIVNLLLLAIDARSLTVALAQATTIALLRIYHRLQP